MSKIDRLKPKSEENMVRIGSRVSKQVNDWLDKKNIESGVPKSTLIYLALDQQMKQDNAISSIGEVIERLKALERKMDEKTAE